MKNINGDCLLTSESVTEGHPDKMADQISDAILDSVLKNDPYGRVAIETLLTNGLVVVAGEISTKTYVDVPKIVRKVVKDIGYTNSSIGFDWETCGIVCAIQEQSPDIARGVNDKDELSLGAGDQGIVYGYATDETPELMPLPIVLAHKLAKQLTKIRKDNVLVYLRPDGKSQITVEYKDGKPKRIHTVLISTQHNPEISALRLNKDIKEKVILPVLSKKLLDSKTKYLINPTGKFVKGGPAADTGLTGRKIIVDTYGGVGSHGGGCFSGKDLTKVDRSGSYAARWVAKNVVAAGLAKKCEIQIAYAIGVAKPLAISVDTFKTGDPSDIKILEAIKKVFDLRPGAIIKSLGLRRPIYRQTACYGHFGRTDLNLPWEKTNKVSELKKAVKV
ncbi:methionine adenosyltransferase [bacterium]|nr:MAG: methionine adenosyltransferase [bacterium]